MRVFVILFILLIGAIAYLSLLNQSYLTIYLARQYAVEVPVVAVILFSMAFGGLLVGAGVGFRGLRNLYGRWRSAGRERREAKARELYTNAANAATIGRYDEAVRHLERLLDVDPAHVQGLLLLGNLRRQQANHGEALRLHRKARVLEENNLQVWMALVADLEASGRWDEAVQALSEILSRDERNLWILTKLRDLYLRLSRWEEAHQVQERVLKLSLPAEERERALETLVGIKYELGRFHLEKDLRDQARKYFKGTIRLDRNFIPGYVGLGEIQIREGQQGRAAELWEKAYQLTGNLVLLHRLEDLYLEMGMPERIIQIYQEAVSRQPSDRFLKFYLGKLYYRLEMLEDASELLSAVETNNELSPEIHKLLGNLYLRRGDAKAAAEEFKKALNFKTRLLIPYRCLSCHFQTVEWAGRCPQCGNWNTLSATPKPADSPSAS